MTDSTFHLEKMDCPTEEQLVRKRLQPTPGVRALRFNLMERELTVTHDLPDDGELLRILDSLGMEPRRKGETGKARRSEYQVPGMCCPTEVELIRTRLGGLPGVESVEASVMDRKVTVAHRLPEPEVRAALESLGMGAEPLQDEAAAPTANAAPRPGLPRWASLAAAGALAVAGEIMAWTGGRESSPLVIALAVAAILLGGRETMWKGWVAVRNLTLNMNFLMSLAVVGAAIIGQWPEAAMVTVLFALAELIEGYSLDRARNAIRGLMRLTPERATVRIGDRWEEVDAAQVAVGQVARVRPGGRIPVDGKVISGESTVNQAPITGESLPVEKGPGDLVFAGTVNERGAFEFEVTANKGHTTLDRIVRAVQEAQSKQAPTQRFVDRFARYYTPVVVFFAVLVAAIPPLAMAQPWTPWLYRALVLLVIACPCALVISTPVTVVSGLAAAARNGVLIKGGVFLEEGRKLKLVALDKTGTLTHGKPAVTDVAPLEGLSREDALHWAASLNAQSEHPVAAAIVGHCSTAHGDRPCNLLPVTDFEAIAGRGVKGTLNGRTHYVGSHRLAHENLRCNVEVETILDRLEREGKTTVVLTDEERPLAVLGVADTLRDTSVQALLELHELGVRTLMLTGDNQTTASAIARSVGIDDARGGLLPEDKLAAIEELRREYGVVGMVGDGMNDAPALARASIGFAMGAAGTDTALETADVALMQDDLRKLPFFIRLSRAAGSILAQNIAFAILVKVVFFALALTGKATLWMAVFADMGASLLVVFNGLRLLAFGSSAKPRAAPLAPGE